MALNGHEKLNPIGAAVKIATLPVPSDIERAAMEKMPIKDAMRQVASEAQIELDAALVAAVEKHLGEPIGDPERLRGRLQHVAHVGHEEEGITYLVDGVPVLWVGPLTTVRDVDTMRASRDMRQLV